MSEELSLSEIGQIHISVADIDEAVAFYRDKLQMKFLFQVPGMPMAFFDCSGVRLYLGVPESPEFRSNPLIYFRVSSIEEAYEALKGRGVEFRDEPHVVHRTEQTELWVAFFHDHEGHPLAIMSEQTAP